MLKTFKHMLTYVSGGGFAPFKVNLGDDPGRTLSNATGGVSIYVSGNTPHLLLYFFATIQKGLGWIVFHKPPFIVPTLTPQTLNKIK